MGEKEGGPSKPAKNRSCKGLFVIVRRNLGSFPRFWPGSVSDCPFLYPTFARSKWRLRSYGTPYKINPHPANCNGAGVGVVLRRDRVLHRSDEEVHVCSSSSGPVREHQFAVILRFARSTWKKKRCCKRNALFRSSVRTIGKMGTRPNLGLLRVLLQLEYEV